MRKVIFRTIAAWVIVAWLFVTKGVESYAIYDPLSVPNNKIGIHILFPEEIFLAKDLANTNNGEWGYVTIPIQAGDKDIKKWQRFMDDARKYRMIPIIRLATEGDYFKKTSWRKPENNDVIDFANFLNSLNWPVKNRYIVVFNEVNRGDEWEGKADPSEYSEILSYAVTVFKSKSQDFFIISSGMDNAASTDGINYSEYDYFGLMDQMVPGIFSQIDGISSHSYPNPAFSQLPSVNSPKSINSFSYELSAIAAMSVKKLPVFITETGWDQDAVSEDSATKYFKEALENTWNDMNIVAITPFLLRADAGPFQKFSFINRSGEKKEVFKMFENLPKTKGEPVIYPSKKVLGTSESKKELPIKDFSDKKEDKLGKNIKTLIRWAFFGL